MLICVGMVFGTSGKHNLWIANEPGEFGVSLSELTTNRGEQNE